MVKFKSNYRAHISKNLVYLDYDKLKAILHEHDDDEKNTKSAIKPLLMHRVEDWAATDARFSAVFFEEVNKVDHCYLDHVHELEYMQVDMMRFATEYNTNKFKKKEEKKAFEAALKRSTTTLHQKVTKLETYRILNRTLALKILQKHQKMTKNVQIEKSSLDSYLEKMNKTSLGSGARLAEMHAQIESLYAELFCHGILEEAQGKLRLDKTMSDPKVLQAVWFKIGVIVTLLLWIVYGILVAPSLSLLYLTMEDPSAYVYAFVGALITYRWFWGFSVYMWDSVDIDYILILDLDANKHMPRYDNIYSDAGTLTILYLVNVLMFDFLRVYHMYDVLDEDHAGTAFLRYWAGRAWIMPLLLIVGTVVRMGFSIVHHTSMGVFSVRIFKELFMAPFVPVHLRHSYAADILCSLNKVFVSAIFSVCYFGSGAYKYASDPPRMAESDEFSVCTNHPGMVFLKMVIMVLPYTIRLIQCLRQRRDHFVRLKMLAAAAAAPKILPEVKPSPSVKEKSGRRIRISSSAKNSRVDLPALANPTNGTEIDASSEKSPGHATEGDSRSEKASPGRGAVSPMTAAKGSKGSFASLLALFPQVQSGDTEEREPSEHGFGGQGEEEGDGVCEVHEDCVGHDSYDLFEELHGAEDDHEPVEELLEDVQDLHEYREDDLVDTAELDEELHEGNNYGFDEDDVVYEMEGAFNPLHFSADSDDGGYGGYDGYVSGGGGRSVRDKPADEDAKDEGVELRHLGKSAGLGYTALTGHTAAAGRSLRAAFERFIPLSDTGAGAGATAPEATTPPETPAGTTIEGEGSEPADGGSSTHSKPVRRHSFYKTLHEGIEVTRRVRSGLKSSLSRSEIADLPMPPWIRAIRNFLPAALRTVMVWPYSYNALRYFCSILVIIIGVYPPQDPSSQSFMGCYYTLFVFSTLFNIYWDVANDFKLLQFDSTRPLLRDNLLYSEQEFFYYAVLVINPIFRFLWLLTFTAYGNQIFILLFEIMRRSLWACLRMELGYIQELARRR